MHTFDCSSVRCNRIRCADTTQAKKKGSTAHKHSRTAGSTLTIGVFELELHDCRFIDDQKPILHARCYDHAERVREKAGGYECVASGAVHLMWA